MTQPSKSSPLDSIRDWIADAIDQGLSYTQIAELADRAHGVKTTRDSVRRAVKRFGLKPTTPSPKEQAPSFKQDGDTVDINSGMLDTLPAAIDLITAHGLDPEEWIYDDPIVSWWGQPGKRSYQLKLKLKRKKLLNFVIPAGKSSYVAPARKVRSQRSGVPELWVLPGDQHAPMHSEDMHRAFLSFLVDNEPAKGLLMGDGLDFADVSRHRDNPEWTNSAQECLDSYHTMLCDYVSSSPDTEWKQLWGNHCLRLRNELLNRAERMYGIKPANDPDARDALSLARLLHFDELGIEEIEPDGEYTHAQVQIAPDLIARHGWLTGPNAMNKALSGLTCSVVYGHVHSAASKHVTRWTPEGQPVHASVYENGTMSEIRGGMGYASDVSWTPGFSTIEVWPDGRWNHDFARLIDGELYWRNERYS